jgi:hypothetical protein
VVTSLGGVTSRAGRTHPMSVTSARGCVRLGRQPTGLVIDLPDIPEFRKRQLSARGDGLRLLTSCMAKGGSSWRHRRTHALPRPEPPRPGIPCSPSTSDAGHTGKRSRWTIERVDIRKLPA